MFVGAFIVLFAVLLVAMMTHRVVDNPVEELHDERETRKIRTRWTRLVRDLGVFNQTESMNQLKSLVERCENIEKVLDARFASHEMTANRYRLVVEEVRLGVLNNLQRQVELIKAVEKIDRTEIEARIRKLDPGSAATVELEKALYDRLALVDSVDVRLARMAVSNEHAITALDKAIVELAALDTGMADSDARFETAVAELEQLVGQAHRLAARPDDIDIVGSRRKKQDRKTIKPGAD